MPAKKAGKQLKVTLVKSFIGRKDDQIATAKALGLKKINDEKLHDDNPQIRGMIQKIIHMVSVEEV